MAIGPFLKNDISAVGGPNSPPSDENFQKRTPDSSSWPQITYMDKLRGYWYRDTFQIFTTQKCWDFHVRVAPDPTKFETYHFCQSPAQGLDSSLYKFDNLFIQ